MLRNPLIILTAFTLVSFSSIADDSLKSKVKKKLDTAFQGSFDIVDVIKMPGGGIYEIQFSQGVIHVTSDLNYAIVNGQYYDISSGKLINLTMKRLNSINSGILSKLDPNSAVEYKTPKRELGVITVFTDPGCVYCRKLHGELPELLDAGYSVRYYLFPRKMNLEPSSPKDGFDYAYGMWCSPDRDRLVKSYYKGLSVLGLLGSYEYAKKDELPVYEKRFNEYRKAEGKDLSVPLDVAMDVAQAEVGYKVKQIESKAPSSLTCKDEVMDVLRVSAQLKIAGTPAMFMPNGLSVPGYKSAKEIIELIQN